MTPGEISACHRLYAAHRKSREICTFAGTIPAMNNAGHPGDLAALLRPHTGLEGLASKLPVKFETTVLRALARETCDDDVC